jgi:hypothetical protein
MANSGEIKGKAIIAAIGYLFKSDYAIPLIVMEELRKRGFEVVDLSLGAFKGASFLELLSPQKLIILAAEKRGNRELRVYKPKFSSNPVSDWISAYRTLQTYDIGVDAFIKVASAMNLLPGDTIIIECEVVKDEEGIGLSEWGENCAKLMINEVLRLLS